MGDSCPSAPSWQDVTRRKSRGIEQTVPSKRQCLSSSRSLQALPWSFGEPDGDNK